MMKVCFSIVVFLFLLAGCAPDSLIILQSHEPSQIAGQSIPLRCAVKMFDADGNVQSKFVGHANSRMAIEEDIPGGVTREFTEFLRASQTFRSIVVKEDEADLIITGRIKRFEWKEEVDLFYPILYSAVTLDLYVLCGGTYYWPRGYFEMEVELSLPGQKPFAMLTAGHDSGEPLSFYSRWYDSPQFQLMDAMSATFDELSRQIYLKKDEILNEIPADRRRAILAGEVLRASEPRGKPEKENVDWTSGKPTLAPYPIVVVELSNAGEVKAGKELKIEVKAWNIGKGDLYQLFCLTKSDLDCLNNKRIDLGRVKPGKKDDKPVSNSFTFTMPAKLPSAEVPVTFEFYEQNGNVPRPVKKTVLVIGIPQPLFEYELTIIDDNTGGSVGNGDKKIQILEAIDLLLKVENAGEVEATDVLVEIDVAGVEGIVIFKGRGRIEKLAPGATASVRLNLQVKSTVKQKEIPLLIRISESGSGAKLEKKIILKIED